MNFEAFLSPQAWLIALGIFAMRLVGLSLDTVRILFVVRGRKNIAWVTGFLSVLLFVVAFGLVMSKMDNPLYILSFCLGFATGNVTGMIMEDRLALGYIQINIISPRLGNAVADGLRKAGCGVTEVAARGKDGCVSMVRCDVLRKNISQVENIVTEIDPSAFITAEEIHSIMHGYWRL